MFGNKRMSLKQNNLYFFSNTYMCCKTPVETLKQNLNCLNDLFFSLSENTMNDCIWFKRNPDDNVHGIRMVYPWYCLRFLIYFLIIVNFIFLELFFKIRAIKILNFSFILFLINKKIIVPLTKKF